MPSAAPACGPSHCSCCAPQTCPHTQASSAASSAPCVWPEEVHGWGRILFDCPLPREAFLGFPRTGHRPHGHLCTAADFCRPASPPAFLKPFSRRSFKIANQMKSASYSRPASGGPQAPLPEPPLPRLHATPCPRSACSRPSGRSAAPAEGHPTPAVRCQDRGRSVRRSRLCPATSSHHPRHQQCCPVGPQLVS